MIKKEVIHKKYVVLWRIIKKVSFVVLICSIISSCKNEEKEKHFIPISKVESYTYDELKPLLYKVDDTIYVINFWATWCAPCIRELPVFEKLREQYKNVEVILVSLDFPQQIKKRLIPFVNKKELLSKVVHLNDSNEDFWINAIDKNWSGAIPATLIYNKTKRKFYEQSFDFKTLEKEIQFFMN